MIDIDITLDRIAVLYRFDKLIDGMTFEDIGEYKLNLLVMSVNKMDSLLKALKPADYDIEISGNEYARQFYLIDDDMREPLCNISGVQYQNMLRIDLNPKRFNSPWIQNVVIEFRDYMSATLNLENSLSQVDLTFDVFDKIAENAVYIKSNVKRTALFNDGSGKLETSYYGRRQNSAGYLRIYDKNAERVSEIKRRYRRKYAKALLRYESYKKNFVGNLTSDNVLADFDSLELDLFPYVEDLTITSNFEDALNYVIGLRQSEEKSLLPAFNRRFEFILRAKRLNGRRFIDDEAVMTELNSIHCHELETISDPVLRSVVVAVESGIVDPHTLPPLLAKQRRQILKHDKIAIFRHKQHVKVMSFNKFKNIPKDEIENTPRFITKVEDTTLREAMKEVYLANKDRLNTELAQYII